MALAIAMKFLSYSYKVALAIATPWFLTSQRAGSCHNNEMALAIAMNALWDRKQELLLYALDLPHIRTVQNLSPMGMGLRLELQLILALCCYYFFKLIHKTGV